MLILCSVVELLEPIPTYRVMLGLHLGNVINTSQRETCMSVNSTQKGCQSEIKLPQTTAAHRTHVNHSTAIAIIQVRKRKRLKRGKFERKMCSQRSMLGKLGSLCVLFSDCTSPFHLSPVLTGGKPHCFHTSHLKTHWSVHVFANSVTLLLLLRYLCKMVKRKGDGKTWVGGTQRQ